MFSHYQELFSMIRKSSAQENSGKSVKNEAYIIYANNSHMEFNCPTSLLMTFKRQSNNGGEKLDFDGISLIQRAYFWLKTRKLQKENRRHGVHPLLFHFPFQWDAARSVRSVAKSQHEIQSSLLGLNWVGSCWPEGADGKDECVLMDFFVPP